MIDIQLGLETVGNTPSACHVHAPRAISFFRLGIAAAVRAIEKSKRIGFMVHFHHLNFFSRWSHFSMIVAALRGWRIRICVLT